MARNCLDLQRLHHNRQKNQRAAGARSFLAPGCKWKVKQPVAILLDLVDEARR